MNRLIVLLLLFVSSLHMPVSARTYARRNAAVQYDSVQISLLTCGPGNQIYSLFGHTAIRVQDKVRHLDWVYNYGIFDFFKPNFISRFLLGATDYELGVFDYPDFLYPYVSGNRWVFEQHLNLKTAEKIRLLQALNINYRPENRVYRYNFFYDNCATRPRIKLEEAMSGKIHYADSVKEAFAQHTYRDIVYECSENHPWARFGMNFCLGLPADKPIDYLQIMFAPIYLKDAFHTATIVGNHGEREALVSSERVALHVKDMDKGTDWLLVFSPMVCFSLLFLLVLALSLYQWKSGRSLWWLDMLLFTAAGICGSLIAFLACFSEHPAVSPNFLLFVFHPIHLFVVPFLVFTTRKRKKPVYHLINLAVLTLFIALFGLIPQRFDFAVVPLALCLLVRSLMNVLCFYKKRYTITK